MKKLLTALILLPSLLFAQGNPRPIIMGDTNRPGIFKSSGITINTNTLVTVFPGGFSVTNGTITLPASSISSSAISGGSSSIISTNITSATGSASTYTWKNIATLTTTATNGTVEIKGQMSSVVNTVAAGWIRVRDSSTNNVAITKITANGITSSLTGGTSISDSLSGTTKSYFMDVADSSGGSMVYTNIVVGSANEPGETNTCWLKIRQIP